MTIRATELARWLSRLSSDAHRLSVGLTELEGLYGDLIRAYLPDNPQFERERIIVALPSKREIAFIFGLYNEGENEAALILELIAAANAEDPAARTSHLLDEMSYYLRTSIDGEWQIHAPLSAAAAVVYLFAILDERLAYLRASSERRAFAFQRRRDALMQFEAEFPLRALADDDTRDGETHRNGDPTTPVTNARNR